MLLLGFLGLVFLVLLVDKLKDEFEMLREQFARVHYRRSFGEPSSPQNIEPSACSSLDGVDWDEVEPEEIPRPARYRKWPSPERGRRNPSTRRPRP
jgi:hypothetical protein